MMLPLEGLIVIAVEQAVAAPFCSSRLADAGAQVIKGERPEGGFARGYGAPREGVGGRRAGAWGRTREPRTADRRRGRADPESQAGLDGQARLHAGSPEERLSGADLLHHIRLWRRRPLPAPAGP